MAIQACSWDSGARSRMGIIFFPRELEIVIWSKEEDILRVMVGAPILAFMATHILYLNVYQYDHRLNTNVCLLMNVVTIGLNTNVCLLMNVVTITLWAVWAGITHHPSRWKLWSIVLGLFPSMILMILDFPPYQGFIDAHAMWHVTMVPITHVWWGFIRDDCEYRTAILTGKTKCCY